MFTVKVSQKNGPEKVIEFSDGEVSIGRVSSNEIVLPKSNISKRHALLTHSSGGLAITDTKSTNGTFVNGERINGVCDLSQGDKIYLGEFTVEVVTIQIASTASSAKSSPSRIETKSQPKLDPGSGSHDKILSDDWGANGEISDSWTGDWKSQTAQAKSDSAAVDVLDMASGFPTIEPSIEAHDFAPEVIIPPAPATATTPTSSPLPYVDGASTASVVENLDLSDMDLDLDDDPEEPEESSESSETLVALMEDTSIHRIEINRSGPVFADRGRGNVQTQVTLTDSDTQGFLNSLLKQAGLPSRSDQALLDFTLPNGSRVQVTQAPIAVNGPHITIHKTAAHPDDLDALDPENLDGGAINYLKQILSQGRSIVVAASGYSSDPLYSLVALAGSIAGSERVVTVSHGAQFNIKHPQSVALQTGNHAAPDSQVLEHALTMQPGYIVDGPSPSSLDNIETMMRAGHHCFIGTIYASNLEEATSLLLLKSPKCPEILITQDNDTEGQPYIVGIYQASGSGYSPLFIRTPNGNLEAIGDRTELR
ncbi:MAG: Flp pilus assembly complex ATPase component TadA [Deltaproteobacteria bacterium]|nr:Flp pilus assembly complex ATPase component TadA [Deltaproteobacteria bacterium]MBT6431663.1 Flp pilus assembly complex ATPase component TadA [Deltaproteobacteria bacterium]